MADTASKKKAYRDSVKNRDKTDIKGKETEGPGCSSRFPRNPQGRKITKISLRYVIPSCMIIHLLRSRANSSESGLETLETQQDLSVEHIEDPSNDFPEVTLVLGTQPGVRP